MNSYVKASSQRSDVAKAKNSLLSAAFKENCRKVISNGLYYSGLLRLINRFERSREMHAGFNSRLPRMRRSPASKFGILCYHRVGTEGVPFHSRLEPEVFEAQMRYLKKRYRIVPLGQLCQELAEAVSVPPTIAITFDDGYRDLYAHAFPVLRKYEIPATIYLIGHCLETGEAPWYDKIFASMVTAQGSSLELQLDTARQFSFFSEQNRFAAAWEIVCYLRSITDTARQQWCADFERRMRLPMGLLEGRMLDWNQIRTMHRNGISFGAHTMSHPSVGRLEPAAFPYEFSHCKKLLESGLDASVDDFAYPFGKPTDGNEAAQDFIGRVKYRSAVTTMEGFNSPGDNHYLLRRQQVGENRSLPKFALDVSRLFFVATPKDSTTWVALSAHFDMRPNSNRVLAQRH